jgi:hypothetical protein
MRRRCLRAMSATLTKQFESFAKCCLELARSAETTERRARLIQMAHEYRLATLRISEERKSRRLLPSAADSHLLSPAAEAPAAASPRLPVASGPGFKAQMFGADKQNPNL